MSSLPILEITQVGVNYYEFSDSSKVPEVPEIHLQIHASLRQWFGVTVTAGHLSFSSWWLCQLHSLGLYEPEQ